ncbi:hypothetical protein DY000_02052908 [Brassica cretica]|uniref:Uncharacterized protein n=1 Tax=Brassica cretica TaxID=69181 RepID=A0ABQ7A6K6_BRACR|nr:hypothetical protein DY000_02052908 [Brassica cretica]
MRRETNRSSAGDPEEAEPVTRWRPRWEWLGSPASDLDRVVLDSPLATWVELDRLPAGDLDRA